jgi:hypothetical protein
VRSLLSQKFQRVPHPLHHLWCLGFVSPHLQQVHLVVEAVRGSAWRVHAYGRWAPGLPVPRRVVFLFFSARLAALACLRVRAVAQPGLASRAGAAMWYLWPSLQHGGGKVALAQAAADDGGGCGGKAKQECGRASSPRRWGGGVHHTLAGARCCPPTLTLPARLSTRCKGLSQNGYGLRF